ncbi:hypothetical protein [Frondihabitans sp. PAMC 28766]|uniref:hypothetical protein n=1 Tax=Frondihabitans sp. PAMC 28766 TaxID=1795630 RepID=UPI0012FFB4FF|nr:hypothetical protein [Frondihabitans sp. PAMC 28766]
MTGSGRVQKLKDYGCQLVSNYDPFSNISISKQSGIFSGGQATYKCYVVVKRGVPTPWGRSTRPHAAPTSTGESLALASRLMAGCDLHVPEEKK